MLILTATACAAPAEPDAWRVATGPLMTRWAAEVNPSHPLAEYPRPQLIRTQWLNLNGLWEYAILPAGDDAPSDYHGHILVPFPIESALSGVMRRLDASSALWYRRTLAVPQSWRGQRVRLHFGAVDWSAQVWVNDHEVGRHSGGFSRFSLDITDELHWDGTNRLVVRVTDPTEGDQPRGKQSLKPEGIFYTPTSGIWQTVWLEPVPGVCIDGLRLTPDLDRELLRVRVAVNSLAEDLVVEAVALADGQEVGRASGIANGEFMVPVNKARPWAPADPFLYDLHVELKQKDRPLDRVESYFGMRTVGVGQGVDGFARIALNNEFVFQLGTLDQGFWPDGIYTAPTDDALRSDLEFLKQVGFNLTRKHVKVEPDRWYYWCDKLGLLVWQDMPSGDNASPEGRRHYETELLHMVEDLYNHPSIIVWVLFNEGWGQYDTERLAQTLKRTDPSRLVNSASGWTDMRVGDLSDLHSYPGPDCLEPELRRASVLGEFGGLGLPVSGHAWSTKCWGYLMVDSREELNARYARLFHQVWALHDLRGLSAAIYTQTTDVETECNGLLTYDRAVCKFDLETLLSAHRGGVRGDPMKIVLADAMFGRSVWSYTFRQPGDNWFKPGFDATSWDRGPAGFGTASTPGSRVNTSWNTSDIWLRREFALVADDLAGVKVRIFHDEDAKVYLNGVLALSVKGFVNDYREYAVSPEALAALRPDLNTVAVHCHQTQGGQYIDVGIMVPRPRRTADVQQGE
jgi:hypothetical protein